MASSESEMAFKLSELNKQLSSLQLQQEEEKENLSSYQKELIQARNAKSELSVALSEFIRAKLPEEKEQNDALLDKTAEIQSGNHRLIEEIEEYIAITEENLRLLDIAISEVKAQLIPIVQLQLEIQSILIQNAAISMLAYRQIFEASAIVGIYTLFKTHNALKMDTPVSDKSEQKSIQPPPSPGRNFGSGT